jgi:hypothetical protein
MLFAMMDFGTCLLVALCLSPFAMRGFGKMLNKADGEGVVRKAAQDGIIRFIGRIFK